MIRQKILLAEDDVTLGQLLKQYLELNNFTVTLAVNGDEAVRYFSRLAFNLCLLDVMLPRKDGFTVCDVIKCQNPEMPVIFLTAKALKPDKLKGFQIGADDYIVKPVDDEELVARIRTVIKRYSKNGIPKTNYTIGSLEFDFENLLVISATKKNVLTPLEASLLRELCSNIENLTDRKLIAKKIWGEYDFFVRKNMDVYIVRLRKILSVDASVKIKNVRNRGFILTVE